MKVSVRHDTPVRVRLLSKENGRIIDSSDMEAHQMGGYDTLWSLMYNAAGVSGGVLWRHPRTGELFPHGLTTDFLFLDDDGNETACDENYKYILLDGALCDCTSVCFPGRRSANVT